MVKTRLLASASKWHLACLSTLYVSQGLPAGFLGLALTTYLAAKGATVVEISTLLSITMIPWTIKFLLGPLVDSFSFLKFGRRRFWILLSQSMMIVSLIPLLFISTDSFSMPLAFILMTHNFFTAFQDISTDALAADSLEEKDLGLANGLMWGSKVFSRGLGMAIATAIFFAYGVSAGIILLMILMLMLMLMPFLSKELPYKVGSKEIAFLSNINFRGTLKESMKGFSSSKAIWAVLFMLIANVGYGVFDVIYNKYFIEELKWTGEMIGLARPWGFWLGGVMGLVAGFLSFYISKRTLLYVFISAEASIFLLLGIFESQITNLTGYSFLIGLEIFDAGMAVIVFSILMSLCTTKASATMFGIFMGVSNISTLIGSKSAPMILSMFDYSGAFTICGLSLLPCLLIVHLMTKSKNQENNIIQYT